MNYYLSTYNDNSLDVSISFKEYLKQISKFSFLSAEDELECLTKFHENGDRASGQTLVTSHLRLVVKMACYYKYNGCELPVMDLISEGTIGLIEAIKKFDFTKKCRLATYAAYHIKAKMYDFIMNSFSMVKIGTSKVARSLFGKYKELVNSNSDEEIQEFATNLDTTSDMVLETKNRFKMRDWSLNNKVYDESENSEFIDEIQCQKKTPEDEILEHDTRMKYLTAIKKACEATLNDEEKDIIYHRIIVDKPLTLRELGEMFSMTPEAIRQKQEKALQKIRKFIGTTGLLEYKENKLLKIC